MPSQQATLGYMKPPQSTIGKFFGNGDSSKAPSQQSQLKFSSTSTTKIETDTARSSTKAEPKIEHAAEDGTNVKTESRPASEDQRIKDEPDSTSSQAEPSATNGKRSVLSAEPDESASDIEPPSKRQKTKISHSTHKKELTKTKADSNLVTQDVSDAVKKKTTSKASSSNSTGRQTKSNPGSSVSPTSNHNDTNAHESDAKESDESDQGDLTHAEATALNESVEKTLQNGGSNDVYPDWKAGEAVPYAALCATLSKIENTTKRLEILRLCSLFLRQVARLSPRDLLQTVLLMLGKLAADYSGIELGIGESLIMKAIGETTGRSLQIIKADHSEIGDLGLVAAKSRSNQPTMFKPKPLTIKSVHDGLMQIALVEGQGAQGRKVAGIKKLLSAADVDLAGKGKNAVDITKDKGGPSESKYIVRLLEGKMRLGLAEKTILGALANAMVHHSAMDSKKRVDQEDILNGEQILKAVFSELPSYEVIIPALLDKGIFKLREACRLQPGVPLKPMLARPTKSITEVLDRFEGKPFSCEYKYDGERAQIHFVAHDAAQDYATAIPSAGRSEKGISNIFSRNSEDLSKKYPDILAKLPEWIGSDTKSFVLDCETVAWDVQEKKVLPFQQLMTRKRKDVKTEDIKVKVCVFAFDLLYLDGKAVVNQSFRERREAMYKAFKPVEGEFAFAQYGNCVELDEIQTMLEDSVKASCEGLMVKMLDGVESHYEPSRRSQNWLKVKKDYLSGAGDSLDLVVLGAYHGKGKRTSVYGAFLLACWNPSSEVFETVCNIGTGFSDEVLAKLYEQLSLIVIDRPKPFYAHSTGRTDQPDVWFESRYVWEVKTADLTLSPRYKAAADQVSDANGRGVSLRFPRFIRERDDKKPESATSSRQIADMYNRQEVIGKSTKSGIDDDFEY